MGNRLWVSLLTNQSIYRRDCEAVQPSASPIQPLEHPANPCTSLPRYMRISRFSTHVKISSSIIASMRTRFTLIEENEARQWYNSSTISTFSETFENGLLSTSWSNSFHWKMALFAWFGRRHQSVPVAMQMSAHPRRGIRGRLRRGDFILRDVPKHRRGAKRMHSHADVRYLLVRKGENSRGESSTRWKYPRYEFSFRYSLLSLRNNRGMKEKKKKKKSLFFQDFQKRLHFATC